MPSYKLSEEAARDVRGIARYSRERWGADQALRYVAGLRDCLRLLSTNPALGQSCEEIRPGLRRLEYGKHFVFYRRLRTGIAVARVLHQRMLPVPTRFEL